MLRLIAALGRSLPLVIALVVLAVIIYFIVAWRRSPARAKEVLISSFTIICSVIAIASILITLYALVDNNTAVAELAGSCAIIGVVGLAITLICRHVFRKHNPHYQWEPTAKAQTIENKPDLLNVITKILNFINDNRRK